jgi:hypothetical protein
VNFNVAATPLDDLVSSSLAWSPTPSGSRTMVADTIAERTW